jgi:hypothetical protein
MMYDLYAAAVKGTASQSVKKIVTSFAKKVANRWFKKYLDDTPSYSAAGRAALQYSGYATEWRLRVMQHDTAELTTYLWMTDAAIAIAESEDSRAYQQGPSARLTSPALERWRWSSPEHGPQGAMQLPLGFVVGTRLLPA